MLTDWQIAEVCHEANRAYCRGLGDDSQVSWADAPEWLRNSALEGAAFFHANPHAPPEVMHAQWCEQKNREGWVYGPEKDVEKKTHPSLVAFPDLPEAQQRKDFLFSAVCRALLNGST